MKNIVSTTNKTTKTVYVYYDEEEFDKDSDEAYPWVDVMGYRYSPTEALKTLDPDAYRQEFLAFQDSKLDEKEDELEDPGICTIGETIFEIRDDEDDEDDKDKE